MGQIGYYWEALELNITSGDKPGGGSNQWSFDFEEVSALVFLMLVNVTALRKLKTLKGNSALQAWILVTLGLLSFPLALVMFIFLALYRVLVYGILHLKYGKDFKGLMAGPDAFWAIEEEESRSAINVLALVDFSQLLHPQYILEGDGPLKLMQKLILHRLLRNAPNGNKLKYERCYSKLGFYFWKEKEEIPIEEYVRKMEVDNYEELTNNNLQNYISTVANNVFPDQHTACWEVLVSNKSVNNQSLQESNLYPVLFRIHHSVGDGVALVTLLLDALADPLNTANDSFGTGPFKNLAKCGMQKSEDKKSSTFYSEISCNESINSKFQKMGEMNTFMCGKHSNKDTRSFNVVLRPFSVLLKILNDLGRKLMIITLSPVSVILQALLQEEKNTLHNPKLCGKKTTAWMLETDENLMYKIKQIKERRKCHFCDVLFTAVSDSIEKYFKSVDEAPTSINVVVPARISGLDEKKVLQTFEIKHGTSKTRITRVFSLKTTSELTNKFSVGILKLPVMNSSDSYLGKLSRVCNATSLLRNSPDYLVNYWLLKIVLTFVPAKLVRPLIKSRQCSLAVSNLPGPKSLATLAGHPIQDLIFWLPNRETLGVGISVLSYSGRLNVGIMADQNVIPDPESAHLMLENIVKSINEMYIKM